MKHDLHRDHYKVLGVPRTASALEVKRAYRDLAKRTHPDRNASDRAAEIFHAVHAAYEVLGDPNRRGAYDHALAGYRPASPRPKSRSDRSSGDRVTPAMEPPLPEPPRWAFVGLHLTGLAFAILLVLGTAWLVLSRDMNWSLLVLTAPGWFLVPECVAGLRMKWKGIER